LGPDTTLTALTTQTLTHLDSTSGDSTSDSNDRPRFTATPTLHRTKPPATTLATALATLHTEGHTPTPPTTTSPTASDHSASPGGDSTTSENAASSGTGTGPIHLAAVLPTYPFQRQRYWLEDPAPATSDRQGSPLNAVDTGFWDAVQHADASTLADTLGISDPTDHDALATVLPALNSWWTRRVTESQADSWRYRIAWRPVPQSASASPASDGDWLLVVAPEYVDHPRVAAAVRALEDAGAAVRRLVVPAAADRRTLATELTRLLAAPIGAAHNGTAPNGTAPNGTAPNGTIPSGLADGPAVAGVLSLLALDESAHPDAAATPLGLAGTVALLQALDDTGLDARLWIATSGAVSTSAADPVTRPADALLWGLGAICAVEYPGRWGGIVDLPDQVDEEAARLLATALRAGHGEAELVVRSGGLLARRLVPAPTEARPAQEPGSVADWAAEGTVLITGGTGALGGHVARWLAREGAAHLLLTSRRGERAPGAGELAEELRALGARVTIAAVDVGDRDALAEVIGGIPAELPLRAVVHTAAVLDDGLVSELTLEQIDRVLRVKVGGALNLHELTRDADLAAFVLFSSIAGTAGITGQGNYAPGNAYLDAFAAYRRAAGLVATSIAWGQWDGAGLAEPDVERILGRYGLLAMDPQPAVRALAGALASDETHLAIVAADWPVFYRSRPHPLVHELPEVAAERSALAERSGRPAGATGDGDGPVLAARLAELDGPARREALLAIVRDHVAAVQGHASPDAVDVDRGFRDQGFDSLAAVNLRNRLIAETGLSLPVSLVFDYPTAAALTDHLLGELVPDEPAGLPAVLAEIDRLESALADVADADREAAADRLRDLLTRLGGPAADGAAVAAELSAASDAELIDFIGKTLGIS
ncbi:SDR family NAD(P)-dependent oxidoreductase, partial [Frankia torreyi]